MSPEQARGKAVDKRADIWAFGVVLFEMLAGRRLFEGETSPTSSPRCWSRSPTGRPCRRGTPRARPQLLRRCLERDPKQRLRDIGEARVALGDRLRPPGRRRLPPPRLGGSPRPVGDARPRRPRSAAAGLGLWTRLRPPAPFAVTRLRSACPPGQVLSAVGGPAISRDGRTLAYTARDATGGARLYVRAARPLRGEPSCRRARAPMLPFFSPDGSASASSRGQADDGGGGGRRPDADRRRLRQLTGRHLGGRRHDRVRPGAEHRAAARPLVRGQAPAGHAAGRGGPGYAHGRPHFLPGSRSVLFSTWGAPEIRGDVVVSL